MKKRNLLYAALIVSVVLALSSCFHDHDFDHHNISIRINDNEDVYRMRAYYDDDLTGEVQRVINTHLKQHHSNALIRWNTEKEITLDDGTVVYIKTKPGRLKIKVDKTENPEEGCERVKEMCDEIKDVLASREDNE